VNTREPAQTGGELRRGSAQRGEIRDLASSVIVLVFLFGDALGVWVTNHRVPIT
jgi:hypothetical protein